MELSPILDRPRATTTMSSALARERDDAVILDVMSKGQLRSLALKDALRAWGLMPVSW
jgi:hypothetical protein